MITQPICSVAWRPALQFILSRHSSVSDNLSLCFTAWIRVALPPPEGHFGANPTHSIQQRKGVPTPEELGLAQQRGHVVSIPEPFH